MDSVAFMGASHPARSLSIEVFRQLNGKNNGHLQLAAPWLRSRGWTSNDVINRAKNELINRGLLILTRQGGMNAGANLYAVTWLPISDFSGLDIQSKNYHQGKWRFLENAPPIQKQTVSSATRCASTPADGVGDISTPPPNGAKTAFFNGTTAPPSGNNVIHHIPALRIHSSKKSRIVGKAGKSGVKKINPQILSTP